MTARPAMLALLILALAAWPVADADESVWERLRGGDQVILLRHAVTTPGVGDPPGFRLDDCATQRNLTDAGRADARRIGAAFRARHIPVGRVLSSRWCRCLETARLAFGRAEASEALDNLFGNPAREPELLPTLRRLASERPMGGNLVLVTHGSTIRALTGIQPAPGELLVLAPGTGGRFALAGRLSPSALE